MAAKDIHMDVEGNVLENIYVREDIHCDADTACTPEPKAKKDKKQLRKRSTSRGGGGGGGIFKTIRSKSYTHFDPDEYSTKNDSKLVLKCSVEMTTNSLTKSRFLFLYEDALIITKQKSSTIFHSKSQVDLRDIWLKDDYQDSVDADSGTSSKATAYRLGWPIATVDLDFPTVEEKNSWVEKLQTMLAIVREKEDTNVIIRLAKNDEEFSVTKKCLVGKTESVRNVLARCAELFHSKSDSRENEFQLQALTSRPSNEDPIPLTGSEILYRIQTKYNREHGDGRKDTTAEDNAEFAGDDLVFRVISLEKKAADDQHKAANGTSLVRFFRQSHEGFFRRNLSELYKDGKLCWLLMRMLSHLYVNGPSSEQIFRRPPAKKQQNLLQEKLEHGKVNFDKVDACDMSQLLKTFLNLLPECLLTTELYDEWFEVPKQNDRTAMISLAKSLVGRLPECNLVLLRHLICVLRRISSESVVNKMPPKSLSICIGQCLLWLPVNATAPAAEMNNQIYKIEIVNRVTEVLIDNALDIFGGECFHLFDHLHEQPLSSSTNEIKETSDVIGSMETENATDMKTEPVLATSSPDHQEDITMYSVFPFDRYSADGANDEEEMGLLHEVTQAMALRRLNGPSLLLLPGALQEPLPSNLPPFGCQATGTDLDLSHRSPPMNLSPEKQSVTDDNNNKEEEDEEEEKEKERSVQIENSLEFCTSSNQLRAEEDVFHVDASPHTREHSHSFLAMDSLSTTAIISAAEPCASSDEIALPSDDDDNRQQYSDDVKSKSSAAESILPSFLSGPPSQGGSTSVVPVGCLDMESCTPIPILVCPDTAETSDAAVEVAVGLKEQSKKLTEITLDEPTQSSSSSSSSSSAAAAAPQSATTESMKSHLPIIVVQSLTSQSVGSSPVIRKAKERNEISTIESKTKFPGRRIAPSPDEGYSTSSIKTSRGGGSGGGGGARRDSEMAPSRIDKRFSPYPENTSPSKLSLQRSAFQTTGRAANSASSDSGLRNETPAAAAARSPPCVAIDRPVTPAGIVRRLTSQIEEREHRLQGPLSPNFKGASGSLTVSPSSVSVRAVHSDDGASPSTASSEHSKFQQHSSRRSSWRREFPSNLQKIDAVKSRPAVPVSPSVNLLNKPITFIGACSNVRAAASQNLLAVANKEERRQNPEETDKPANEQIISLSRRRKDPVANVSPTHTKPEDSSPGPKERTSDKDSQKPSREDEQPLRHSDPKMTPRQARERRRSDIGVAEMRTRNKENKENTPGRCCQLQKRPSPNTTELISSTREKVSRISTELDDEMIGKLEEETSPAMTTTKSETMSVKNREWHRQLTEQYSTAAAAAVSGGTVAAAAATSVTIGCSASRRPQRSVAQLGSKISYTPAPLRVFHHGTERSRAAATSAAAKKS